MGIQHHRDSRIARATGDPNPVQLPQPNPKSIQQPSEGEVLGNGERS